MLQTVTRPGRPPLGTTAMPDAERKARSRAGRQVEQLNVEVPATVREAVRDLAEATGRTQAEVILAALQAYLDRHR